MSQPKKSRRRTISLLLTTGVLAASGGGAWWQLNQPAATVSAESGTPSEATGFDAIAQSWGAEPSSDQPSSDQPSMAEPAIGQLVTPRRYDSYVQPASFKDVEVARGQSPDSIGNSLRSGSSRLSSPANNQLRGQAPAGGRYASLPAGADDARRAFGQALAAEAPAKPAPIKESSAQLAAFEDNGDAEEAFAEPIPFANNSAGQLTPPAPHSFEPLPESAPAAIEAFGEEAMPMPSSQTQPELAAMPNGFKPLPLEELPVQELPLQELAEPRQAEEPRMASIVTQRSQAPPADNTLRSAPEAFDPSSLSPPTPQPMTAQEPSSYRSLQEPAPMPQGLPSETYGASSTPSLPGSGRPGERAMEGRQQPTLAIQKFAPAEVQVGKPARFVIKVRNVGQRPAVGVVVRDQTPQGTKLMSTSPAATADTGQIAWELGTMSPGEERTLEMEVTPLEEGEIGSVATVSFSAQASARSRCTRPQLAIRMTAPSQVLVGREQRVQIELRNPGTGDATGVVLLENVPENLRHEAGPALEFEVGTLRAGETRTLELVMHAERAGHVANVLTARADGNIEVEQKVEFDVVAPQLAVGLDGPKRRYLERPATYTVSIQNPGTAAAKDVRLVTRLPQGMRFVKANNLGEYDASTHSVYWSLAELPEGETGEVQLTALPVTSGDLTIQVEGEASEGLKDETALGVQVEGIAALNFEVLDVEDPIEVGGETMYEVRVTNQGTKSASNVTVRLVMPPGMQPIAASGETRHSVVAGAVVFSPLERLAPQAESLFRVRVKGVRAGDQRLTVEVGSDDLTQPVRKEESTRVFGDE